MNCKTFQNELPDLLLAPAEQRNPAAVAHMKECPPCEQEFLSFQATFGLLDSWAAPEPSPYFNQKVAVRIREEQSAPRMGWFERLRTHLQLNTGHQFRPVMAGALALVLLAGGGTATLTTFMRPVQPESVTISATVDDLQILDRNEQEFQQMDQLLQDDDAPAAAPDQARDSMQPIA